MLICSLKEFIFILRILHNYEFYLLLLCDNVNTYTPYLIPHTDKLIYNEIYLHFYPEIGNSIFEYPFHVQTLSTQISL